MSASLAVVTEIAPRSTPAETISQRVMRLQAEARAVAREHLSALENAMTQVAKISEEIADGGEAYPVGARELAKRLADETGLRVQALDAILARTSR